MDHTNPSQFPRAAPAWQNIGEIRLPVGPDNNDAIPALLEEKLDPLPLPVELIPRIVKSIQEVSGRAKIGVQPIHLFLFVPANYKITRGSWGFFRIERIDAQDGSTSFNRAVDLYLYPEAG